MNSNHYDIVIIGGGLVGLSLAFALANQPLRIAIVEAISVATKTQTDFDMRAVAISDGSRQILQALTIWEQLATTACPIMKVHVSDRGHFGASKITAKAENLPALGYVLNMTMLNEVMYRHLTTLKNIDFLCPATLQDLQVTADGYQMTIDQPQKSQQLSAKLVIAADGVHSKTRQLLGITTATQDYQQYGVITTVGLANDHQHVAYERFTTSGPLALLPLPDKRSGLIWCVNKANADQLRQLTERDFLTKLQRDFGYRLGRFTKVGKRQIFPLQLICAQEQVRPGLLLLGNSAHNLHPVAGQGFNLSLRDVFTLAQRIISAQQQQRDFASYEFLLDHVNQRQADQDRVIRFTDRVVKTFSNKVLGLAQLRSKGLLAMELMPFIKSSIINMNTRD